MAQVLPMMERPDFAAMGEPTTEYDIHAQNPEQELSAAAAAGAPQDQPLGHPAMAVGGGQYGGYPYDQAAEAAYANDVEEELQAATAGGPPPTSEHAGQGEPQLYVDPARLAQPLKLFVGQVPKNMTEEDLAFVFDPYGRILDLTVIRDRRSGNHRGCAFVTYESGEDAMKVVADMHGKFKFDGAPWPAQVRPAAGEIDDGGQGRDVEGERCQF